MSMVSSGTPTAINRYTPVAVVRPSRTLAQRVPSPEVMTIDDLAAYLQLSKSSLYKLVQGGRFPATKIGRHWRFHKEAIDEWLKRSQHAGRR